MEDHEVTTPLSLPDSEVENERRGGYTSRRQSATTSPRQHVSRTHHSPSSRQSSLSESIRHETTDFDFTALIAGIDSSPGEPECILMDDTPHPSPVLPSTESTPVSAATPSALVAPERTYRKLIAMGALLLFGIGLEAMIQWGFYNHALQRSYARPLSPAATAALKPLQGQVTRIASPHVPPTAVRPAPVAYAPMHGFAVFVGGAVHRPGIQFFAPGARIADALLRADNTLR